MLAFSQKAWPFPLLDTLREFHQTKHDDLLALWAGTRQYMKTCQYHPMTLRSPESLTILP
ncbi:hypothetical protein AD937_06980 [Gluconobacter japonicus]|nr:hypothetical protein AD937_06980 [Gluconobacter japonicus]